MEWNGAADLVARQLPSSQRVKVDLLDHLVGIGLVRAVPGASDGWTHAEDRVDIAFGRLRHHLVASRLTNPDSAVDDAELVKAALEDPGLAEALALVLPEVGRGELVDLSAVDSERSTLMPAWLAALPWRSSESLHAASEGFLVEALRDESLEHGALDALLVLVMRPGQAFDHDYLHGFLARHPMPRRDAGWCWYLHQAFERTAPPSPLTRLLRAPWESEPDVLTRPLREAWCVVLGWCGGAADLRVRDHAVKAAVRVSESDPGVWAHLVERFAAVDDETVLEGVLCAAYGAILRNPESSALGALARAARDSVLRRNGGPPAHAVVRDLCRSIGDWAHFRSALPPDITLADFQPPFDASREVEVPSAESLEQYKDQRSYPQIYASVMSEMTGDFAKYTVPFALGSLESVLGRQECQRWLLGEVIALGYNPRLHAFYDHHMINTHGHLRSRPAWAERIGEKYQRIALARLVGGLDDVARANGVEAEGLAGERLRRLDPSFLARGIEAVPTEMRIATWWAPSAMDFGSTADLSDIDWVACDDFPDPALFVQEVTDPTRPEQRWRLLDAFFDWENKEPGDEASRYRFVRMHVTGYFVAKGLLNECVEELAKTDLFGCSLPEGFDKESGTYVGEYPWAPAFPDLREPPDTWEVDSTPLARFDLQPLRNRLITLTDSTMVDTLTLRVPAAPLALAALARWNGEAGFRLENGREVFKDPSFGALGPSALMVDVPTLERLLEEKDAAIVWTVVAERFIVGDHGNEDFCGQRHISAVVWMEGNDVRVRRALGEYLRPDRTRVRA